MANRIQGITVEIAGDTTKLSNALKAVNSSIKTTQSQLKDVEKLLKLDPTNTELLAQKEKLLAQAISDTSDKLQILKNSAEQANEALARGEISQSQYDALQREIIETEQSLKSLESQAGNTKKSLSDAFVEAGYKVTEFGNKVTAVGGELSKYVTGPIVGIGVASVAAFKEVDEGFDTIATKTGATGEELESLQDTMRSVYGGMAVSASDAGIAIGEVNTRFNVTGDVLEDLSTRFLEFASINNTDVNSAIDSVDSIMKKYNIDVSQANNVLGLLTRAGQDTGISMETLEGALTSNGAALKEMGLDLASSVNLLAQMEANGVDTSTAIASLKKAVANATKEGLSADQALAETIESIRNASSETEALSIATELFGSKGAPEMTQAIREGRLSVDDLKTSLSEYGSVVETTFNNTLDPTDQANIALNNLKLAGTELATSMFNAVSPALQSLVASLQKAVTWFSNLDSGTKETIVKIAALVAALGPVLIVVGKVISAVGTLMTIIPKLSGAFTAVKGAIAAFNVVCAANPLLLIIAAVVAVIAIFTVLWNNCEEFRNFWINLWNDILSAITSALESIRTAVTNIWNNIKSTVSSVVNGIKTVVTTVFTSIVSGIRERMTNVFNAVKDGFTKVKEHITGLASQALQWGKDLIMGIVNGIKSCIGEVGEAASAIADKITSFLHFSTPDEGPLADYEKWMPDFMNGLAKGIDKSKAVVADSVKGLAEDMVLSPTIDADANMQMNQSQQTNALSGILSGIQSLTENIGNLQMKEGDIVVPVYIGGTQIDEIVLSAQSRRNLRSGGRA